jgi:hypothetical protein
MSMQITIGNLSVIFDRDITIKIHDLIEVMSQEEAEVLAHRLNAIEAVELRPKNLYIHKVADGYFVSIQTLTQGRVTQFLSMQEMRTLAQAFVTYYNLEI